MFSSAESSFMSLAMDQAKAAYQNNEVPVGAIIVKDNEVIGKGRNRVIQNQNVSSHAEIEAIIDASKNAAIHKKIDSKLIQNIKEYTIKYQISFQTCALSKDVKNIQFTT